jgi:hypothetical protein
MLLKNERGGLLWMPTYYEQLERLIDFKEPRGPDYSNLDRLGKASTAPVLNQTAYRTSSINHPDLLSPGSKIRQFYALHAITRFFNSPMYSSIRNANGPDRHWNIQPSHPSVGVDFALHTTGFQKIESPFSVVTFGHVILAPGGMAFSFVAWHGGNSALLVEQPFLG